MNIIGIIPARYGSTRFPGKPLAMIGGKSMIERVYRQACKAKALNAIVVATDDERILRHVKDFGGKAVMTSSRHRNGTERCAEALSLAKGRYAGIINIQGDEPFIHPRQIDLVAQCLEEGTEIATLVKRIKEPVEFGSPMVVKAVVAKKGEALYFSRARVPYAAGKITRKFLEEHIYYKHIGIYGYKASVLKSIVKLKPSRLEKLESLEQLRWLENGFRITVKETAYVTRAVDTPADLMNLKFKI